MYARRLVSASRTMLGRRPEFLVLHRKRIYQQQLILIGYNFKTSMYVKDYNALRACPSSEELNHSEPTFDWQVKQPITYRFVLLHI